MPTDLNEDVVERVAAALNQTSVTDDAEAAVREVAAAIRELAREWDSSTVMDIAGWLDGTL